ncbi:MAG: FtsX-like permease family protein [Fibrobacterota bacterium]
MGLLFKIAWRNIMRHKGKSLVIGSILFLGAFLMTAGDAVVSGMDEGLKSSVVNGFTGDILVMSKKQIDDNVFMSMMGKAVEPINNYKDIKAVLQKQPYLEVFLPAGKNMAIVLNEDGGTPGNAFIIGVDFEAYGKMFPNNFKVIEGQPPRPHEKGVMVPTGAREQFYDFTSIWFIPESTALDTANLTKDARENRRELSVKTNTVFMGFNNDNSTNDIRLPVRGVMKYSSLNHIWGHFVLMDIESFRNCMGYIAASEKADSVPSAKKALLEMADNNLDALFSDASLMVTNTKGSFNEADLKHRENAAPAVVDVENGTFNMVFVKLKKGMDKKKALDDLNKALEAAKVNARAVGWEKATGVIGSLTLLIKTALFVFVMILFFVAIIIIVNTLSMAALERTTEIGMMRAVGARKGFISRMFFAETAMLSFVFGGLGIAIGAMAVKITALIGITSTNDMVQLLFGGDTFQPMLTGTDVFLSVLQLALVTIIAVIYPLRVARGITPLDAISRD